MKFRSTSVPLLLLLLAAAPLSGQARAVLDPADATAFPEPFSLLNGARELSDGRLIVSDWTEERVVVLDLARGPAREVARRGAGPAEFRLPGGLLAFRGDSTVLIDRGNDRLAVLDPEGTIRRTIRPVGPGAGTPGGVDRDGRLYFVRPGWAAGVAPGSTDPLPIVRWDPETGELAEVARVDIARPRSDAGQPRRTPGIPFVMFAARDAWVVDGDGSVGVVHPDPYRVEWIRPDGRTVGPSIEAEPGVVTDEDRVAFVRRFLERTPVSGRGPDGGPGRSPVVSDEEIRRMVETNEFAERHAPFDPTAVHLGPDGRLWVRSSPPTREAADFDVFDAAGERVGRVALPPGRRLLLVGARHLYAVARDALDLETIERYGIPELP